MKHTPWSVLLTLGLVACSGSKSAQTVDEQTPQIELSSTDDFEENSSEASSEPATEDVLTENSVEENSETSELTNNEPLVPESSLENAIPPVSGQSGQLRKYTAQKNETLMMIAFKLYGDYGRWREIANQNSTTLKNGNAVKAGMVLNYLAPEQEFVWNPQGNPYLIKTGDTLGLISKQVYSTTAKWKKIWDNNRPLIKDPNKIYAGFTIYYLEDGREVANQ